MELVARFHENTRRAQQHGDMSIMAAGMHDASRAGPVLQVRIVFFDWQSIHVGAQDDNPFALRSGNCCHNPKFAD